jgi:hypothetical protein
VTNLEYLLEMFNNNNIKYTLTSKLDKDEEEFSYIELERGYVGFTVCITFDKYGNFKDIGAYEY